MIDRKRFDYDVFLWEERKENKSKALQISSKKFFRRFVCRSFFSMCPSKLDMIALWSWFCFIFLLRDYWQMSKNWSLDTKKYVLNIEKFVLSICFYSRVNMIEHIFWRVMSLSIIFHLFYSFFHFNWKLFKQGKRIFTIPIRNDGIQYLVT